MSDSIRDARQDECAALTALALEAKAHWGYPAAALERWRAGLTVTPALLAEHTVRVAESGGRLAGFALLEAGDGPVRLLDSLFVAPFAMGRGIGTQLLRDAQALARAAGARELAIDADPNAVHFYLARGAVPVGEVPAPIAGQPDRVRPQLRLLLAEQ